MVHFIDFLDTNQDANSAIENLGSFDQEELAKVVSAVESFVPDDKLKHLVSPEAIIEVLYPSENVTYLKYVMNPEEVMMAYYPELYDEIMKGEDESRRTLFDSDADQDFHGISLYDPERQLIIKDVEACIVTVIEVITGTIGVLLGLVSLLPAGTYAKFIGSKLGGILKLRKGEGPFIDMFMTAFDDGIKSLNAKKRVWSWIQGMWELAKVMGIKFLYKAIRDAILESGQKISPEAYYLLMVSFLAQLIAWNVTGWVAFVASAASLAADTKSLYNSIVSMMDKCADDSAPPTDCYDAPPDCQTENLCLRYKAICEYGEWHCEYSDVLCDPGLSCQPVTGLCKSDDELVPCVAVIDEDSAFGYPNQASRWSEFRTKYPSRPFCLLVPNPKGEVSVPQSYLDDEFTVVHYNIVRDKGDPSKAENWAAKCGIDKYTRAQVEFAALFIDDSGSMHKSDVKASYDKFIEDVAAVNLKVMEVVNTEENWILPFLTTLAPDPACVTKDGRKGICAGVSECNAIEKVGVEYHDGDPAPNCRQFPSDDVQCCVDPVCISKAGDAGTCTSVDSCTGYSVSWQPGDPTPNCRSFQDAKCCVGWWTCTTNDGAEGTCEDEAACIARGRVPVKYQPGDPVPNCYAYPSTYKCCVDA